MKELLIAVLVVIAALVPSSVKVASAGSPDELVSYLPGGALTDGIITAEEWHECATVLGGRPANTQDLVSHPWTLNEVDFEGWINPFVVFVGPDARVFDITGQIIGSGFVKVCTTGDGAWESNSPFVSTTATVATKNSVTLEICNTLHRIVCAVPAPVTTRAND